LTFRWAVSEGAFVTVEVKRPNGTIVRRITRWSAAGAGSSTWDGRTSAGKVARDGKYEITVTPRDRAGNEGASDRLMIKVLTALRAPAVEPPLFWPTDADALAQTMTFRATLRESATLLWRIINKGGDTVRTGIAEGPQAAGPVTWTWDGLNDAGEPARDGTYTSVVTVTTEAGTYSHTQPVRLSPFQLKAKVDVAAGQRQTIVIFATEPVRGRPTITVKQPGMAAYTLTPVRVSATKFTASWTARRGRAGTVRLTIASTDIGGGTQEKVYPVTLR
jgi:flagellar hook assembly protein FlgD